MSDIRIAARMLTASNVAMRRGVVLTNPVTRRNLPDSDAATRGAGDVMAVDKDLPLSNRPATMAPFYSIIAGWTTGV